MKTCLFNHSLGFAGVPAIRARQHQAGCAVQRPERSGIERSVDSSFSDHDQLAFGCPKSGMSHGSEARRGFRQWMHRLINKKCG